LKIQSYKKPRLKYILLLVIPIILFHLWLSASKGKDEIFEAGFKQLKSAKKFYDRGRDAFSKGNHEKALRSFQKCIEKMPRHAYAHYQLANLFYIKKDFEDSLAHMEQTVKDLDFMQGLNAYIDDKQLASIDDFKRGLERLWESTNSCRDSREIEMSMAQLDKSEGDVELAAKRRKRMEVRQKAHYLFFYGNIFYQLDRFPEALKQYQRAVALDPRHAGATNNVIALLYMGRKYPEAMAVLDKAMKQGLDEELNLKLIEMVYKALDRPVEGILQEYFVSSEGNLEVMRFALAYTREEEMLPAVYENAYIVFHTTSKNAVIIDPGVKDDRIEKFIKKNSLHIKGILHTHGHRDHIGASRHYAGIFSAPIYIHQADADYFDSPPDQILKDNDILKFDGFSFKVLHTPGHSRGSVCFLVGDFLFSGDTLFRNSIGRVWEDGKMSKDKMRHLLLKKVKEKILPLPPKIKILPGHGKTTTLTDEVKNNPYLKN
jgi:glyoxylase-like metal-dependent hydrolase (beta-lactamase superfamily II)/Tfp pilus assembly protein PilF